MKGKIIENVKDYIKDVIEGKYLKEKEKVYIVRAYTFINKEGQTKSIITEIPFEYAKPKEKIIVKENSYPFSYVFSALDLGKPIINLNKEEEYKYYLKYSKEKFDEVANFFKEH